MNSRSAKRAPDTTPPSVTWRHRLFALLGVAIALVVAYFILAAFIPRWWAQRVASAAGHGSFAKGTGFGLAVGLICTLIPLLLLLLGTTMWRRRGGRFVAGAAVVVALALALPNLMTLTVVLGGSNAAHAGERILDVDAPGFRGASLIAAIVAAVLFAVLAFAVLRRRFRVHRTGTRGGRAQSGDANPTP